MRIEPLNSKIIIIILLKVIPQTRQCLVTNCLTCVTSQEKPVCDFCEEGYEKTTRAGSNGESFDTCIQKNKTNTLLVLVIAAFLSIAAGIIIWMVIIKVWLSNPKKAKVAYGERERVNIHRKKLDSREGMQEDTERNKGLVSTREDTEREAKTTEEYSRDEIIAREFKKEAKIEERDRRDMMTPKKKHRRIESTASGGDREKRHHLSFTPGRVTKFIQNALKKKSMREQVKSRKEVGLMTHDLVISEIQEQAELSIQVSQVILNLNDNEVKIRSEKKLEMSEKRRKSILEARKRIFDSQSRVEDYRVESFKGPPNPYLEQFSHNQHSTQQFHETAKKRREEAKRSQNLINESPKFLHEKDMMSVEISSDDDNNFLFKKMSPQKLDERPITLSSYISSPQKVRIFAAPRQFQEKKRPEKFPSSQRIRKNMLRKVKSRASVSSKSPKKKRIIIDSSDRKRNPVMRKALNSNMRVISKEEYDIIRRTNHNRHRISIDGRSKKGLQYFSFDRGRGEQTSLSPQRSKQSNEDDYNIHQRPILISRKNSPERIITEIEVPPPRSDMRRVEARKIDKKLLKKPWFKKPELKPEKEDLQAHMVRIESSTHPLRSKSVNNEYNRRVLDRDKKRSHSVQRDIVDPFLKNSSEAKERPKFDPKDVLKYKIEIPRPMYSQKPSNIGGYETEEANFMEKSSDNNIMGESLEFKHHPLELQSYTSESSEFEDGSSRQNAKADMIFDKLPLIEEESEEYDQSVSISGFGKSQAKYYNYEA